MEIISYTEWCETVKKSIFANAVKILAKPSTQ